MKTASLTAAMAGGFPGKPIWSIQGNGNLYLVFNGRYTANRILRGGRLSEMSLMHPCFIGIRNRIDAAIQAALLARA
jgi:hypothetical protein